MKVLGLDPGLERVGWGVVERRGSQVFCLGRGLIQTPGAKEGWSLCQRLEKIHQEVGALVKLHQPEAAAMEKLFFAKNQTTAMDVARASGVILLACQEGGVPVGELSPPQVKLGVVGHGGADKVQVQFMVRRILGIQEEIRPDDVADALAVALAWTFRQSLPA